MHLFGITTANDDITAEQLALAQESGIRVCLWDIRKQKEHEDAFLKSPDFIQSNDIIYMLKAFGKYKK